VGKLNCQARGVLGGGGPDAECIARVESKFASVWARIEARGGCVVSGDAATVESLVDGLVADLVAAIPPTTSLRHRRRLHGVSAVLQMLLIRQAAR
jgi:hypothetical protein